MAVDIGDFAWPSNEERRANSDPGARLVELATARVPVCSRILVVDATMAMMIMMRVYYLLLHVITISKSSQIWETRPFLLGQVGCLFKSQPFLLCRPPAFSHAACFASSVPKPALGLISQGTKTGCMFVECPGPQDPPVGVSWLNHTTYRLH